LDIRSVGVTVLVVVVSWGTTGEGYPIAAVVGAIGDGGGGWIIRLVAGDGFPEGVRNLQANNPNMSCNRADLNLNI
jgi:hypothetical protein